MSDEAWMKFTATGSVQDYLNYCNAEDGEEESIAAEYRRADNKGAGGGRE